MVTLKDITLLYVEDEQELCELMSDFLEDEVKTLLIAKDGEEGLKMFNQHNPDIVMSDIYMPKIDGISMSEQIKKSSPEKPIIMITAFTNPDDMKRAIEIGIDYYISKPIQNQEQIEKPLHQIAKTLQLNKDKKRLEKLLQVQAKTAAIGEMVNNIGHQWRQPLATISTSCASMKVKVEIEGSVSNEDLQNHIKTINIQTQYLSNTISNFNKFLSPELEQMKQINLKDSIEHSFSVVDNTMKNDSIECIQELDDIVVYGNEVYLAQVFINILNNSIDAISLNETQDKYIFISIKEENSMAVITFRDSGGGIEEDIIDKIYEPYFTTKHQSQGTGLGLYIVFGFLSKYQGNIEAQNVEYEYNNKKIKGAEFTITIPIKHSS